ncbi:MAG: hypothetical protein J6N72_00605, partial [Psychrobacter sp.]|nr:hypothetical protein [Psychrobacter sp.]
VLASKCDAVVAADRNLSDAIDTLKSKNEWRVLITSRGNQMVNELPIINKIVMEFKQALDSGEAIPEDYMEALNTYKKNNEGIPRKIVNTP